MSHDPHHKTQIMEHVKMPDCSEAILEEPALSPAELQEAFDKANR